ncbi:non-canonical purine NTP diphosphatase [Psychroflexus halocasei]|uniref:dITP/XTP pyrophosphatase n=1 Tax=Psychroflexus halocasei TaxID=908615 RepID=A0A1H4DK34_9FLAO|nr:non-canonical purine NTP diphosphatase [Psychroflexus halocasei]SEA73074.1 XTP/dITP diphosphohydrolase [Psychroflexus halocasei]
MKLIFATHNANKLKEVSEMMPEQYELVSLTDLGYHDDIEETSDTIEGNAQIKAETIAKHFGMPCFADDTGLEVDALNGEPGVRSARYASEEKSDEANRQKLLKELNSKNNRKAHFKTVICFVNNGEITNFKGICKGEILEQERGEGGFGYDALFQPDNYEQSFAEMSSELKNTISHRALAFQKFIKSL